MKKSFLLWILPAVFLTNVSVGESSNDFCSKLSGHWQGIYTIKDQSSCKLYNGCTHLVTADASYISGSEYHIHLTPAVGKGGEFNIKCENGEIISPVNPGNKTSTSCDTMNHCFIIYDDPKFTAEVMKK